MFRDPEIRMADLAAELRHGAGSGLADELEITETETEQGRRRRLRISDVWKQAMHRGDTVVVTGAFGRLVGSVDYVGVDYAAVVTDDSMWDVRTDRCVVEVRRSPRGGHTVTGGSRTFRARLAEYEATGEFVTLHVPESGLELSCVVTVAATDHVTVDAAGSCVTIPTVLVHAIRRGR